MRKIPDKMTLYHGSPFIIREPIYRGGNPRNDYGPGFYCTEQFDLAGEWACSDPSGGFINQYAFDAGHLTVLDLSDGEHHILNWLTILLENRIFDITTAVAARGKDYLLKNYLPNYADCDVIIGYRADDSYFSFARAFLNNQISLSQLDAAMHLGQLGEQVVLKSKKAFESITFTGADPADPERFYPRRKARDGAARAAFRRILQENDQILEGVYLLDILREEWKNDDPRLR